MRRNHWAKHLPFSQRFQNHHKIFKFCEEKAFRSCKHFFETLKANSQEMAQYFEITVLRKSFELFFTPTIYTLEHPKS
jgi:hypothetical protein